MKLAQTREARALALAAVRRGLVAPEALWDMACRWTLGGAESPRELLAGVLQAEQLEELALDPEGTGAPRPTPPSEAHAPDRRGFETLNYGLPNADEPGAQPNRSSTRVATSSVTRSAPAASARSCARSIARSAASSR